MEGGAGGEGWAGKVAPAVDWAQLERHRAGLIALTGCCRGPLAMPLLRDDSAQAAPAEQAVAAAHRLRDLFGPDHLFVELQHHALPDDDRLLRRLLPLAHRLNLPLVATHNVHYAEHADSRLRDALIAIRHNQPLTAARQAGLLPLNSSYALASPAEMARRFRELPAALHNSVEIASRCQVSLDFSGHRLPTFPTPDGQREFEYLYELCHANLHRRYPTLTPAVLKQVAHELDIIERAGLAGYFLIVWDIVRFAREQGIRCQGRGSAANSIVAYLLEITSIDPLQHNLLFERFLSEDKFTTPDIDVDFAADRREEVIQYVYRRYGLEHAAMVCNVVTYRARSALRDLGKALDFPAPVIERLVASLDTHSPTAAAAQLEQQFTNSKFEIRNSDSPSHPLALLADLLRRIDGCPRHLSIHSGGMLITGPRLDEIVPLEPATMPGRLVCQWDKDSVEDAGLIKIDLLGLGGLGLISEALAHIQASQGRAPDVDALPLDDPEIYRMLQQADTIGAFQVESRAQQQMLPRLQPACFEDIAVQVAIVRPGPIQGGAVHPYLRRRGLLLRQQRAATPGAPSSGQEALATEPVTYLHPCLEPVLGETLGVLLFQEQAIRVSMAAAGFSPGEADMLRRAMSRSRSDEAMAAMRERFLRGAQAQGMDAGTAEAIFTQLAGFAGYGFCKSHAASFALIAYQTMHLKRYHAPAFYCALLNQQPMGFYSTEVVVGDARRHGVDLLPPDVNRSEWRYILEMVTPREEADPAANGPALRTGLCAVSGLGDAGWRRLEVARSVGPFADLRDLCHRTRLPRDVVNTLIRAGACDAFGQRRQLLWQLGDIDYRPDELDLILPTMPADLPELHALTEMVWEYELLGLSPAGQVMGHYRDALRRAGVFSVWQIKQADGPPAGQRVRVAGMVAVRQRPATAKGITFISLEDESGLLDLVVKPDVYQKLREVLHYAVLLMVEGIVQRAGAAVSVLVQRATRFGEPGAS